MCHPQSSDVFREAVAAPPNGVRERLQLTPADIALTGGDGVIAPRAEAVVPMIRSTRLLAESSRHAAEQAALFRIGQAAISSLDLVTVLQEIAQATLGLVGADCCAIDLWHREMDQAELVAEATVSGWPPAERHGVQVPLVARTAERLVLEHATPLLVVPTDPRVGPDELTLMTTCGVEQLLIVPLVVGETCLGAIRFASREARAFGESALRLGQEIAA
ncbi:MAG: hypothetical protein QOF01_4308, partial [Thermomicrobiales bacterium]|nr:hypothetical protein [Thermomicrobiales bacterium]